MPRERETAYDRVLDHMRAHPGKTFEQALGDVERQPAARYGKDRPLDDESDELTEAELDAALDHLKETGKSFSEAVKYTRSAEGRRRYARKAEPEPADPEAREHEQAMDFMLERRGMSYDEALRQVRYSKGRRYAGRTDYDPTSPAGFDWTDSDDGDADGEGQVPEADREALADAVGTILRANPEGGRSLRELQLDLARSPGVAADRSDIKAALAILKRREQAEERGGRYYPPITRWAR